MTFLTADELNGDASRELREKDIESRVVRYAKSKGLLTDKFTSPSKRAVPDQMFTVECYPFALIFFIEFKAPGKVATEKQKADHQKRAEKNAWVFVVDDVDQGKKVIDDMIEMAQFVRGRLQA